MNVSLLHRFRMDHPGGRGHRFQSPSRAILQPVTQIAASVPATALFPVLLLAIVQLGGGLGGIGSADAARHSVVHPVQRDRGRERDSFRSQGGCRFVPLQPRRPWRIVILPGIFPYLVTGLVTASGGAWNASIVAEYFHFKDSVMSTVGLGAQISAATDAGRFDVLLLATIVMATMVVCTNRLVWRPLYRLAETKYRLES